MPAKSKAQQRLMALALQVKQGDMSKDDFDSKSLYKKVKELADSMSKEDLEDYAETKHKNLPNKKEQVLRKYIRKLINEYSRSLTPPEPEIDPRKVFKKFHKIMICLEQVLEYIKDGDDIKYAIEELNDAMRKHEADFVFNDIAEIYPYHEDDLEPAYTIIEEGTYKPEIITEKKIKRGLENLSKIWESIEEHWGLTRWDL